MKVISQQFDAYPGNFQFSFFSPLQATEFVVGFHQTGLISLVILKRAWAGRSFSVRVISSNRGKAICEGLYLLENPFVLSPSTLLRTGLSKYDVRQFFRFCERIFLG